MTETLLGAPVSRYQLVRCALCDRLVAENWLVRHRKSGCQAGVREDTAGLDALLAAMKAKPLSPDRGYGVVEWRRPDALPIGVRTILVVFEDQVWPGVYAPGDGRVHRYPEDFPPMRLAECEWWALLPARPGDRG